MGHRTVGGRGPAAIYIAKAEEIIQMGQHGGDKGIVPVTFAGRALGEKVRFNAENIGAEEVIEPVFKVP